MTLKDITKYNDEFIRIAVFLGANPDTAADIVQDLYLKFAEIEAKEGDLNRFAYDDTFNKAFIVRALRNRIVDDFRKYGSRFVLCNEIADNEPDEPFDLDNELERDKALDYLESYIDIMTETPDYYHFLLFKTYIKKGHSIRSLHSETGIGTKSIFLSLKFVKENLKQKFNGTFKGK